MLDWDLFSEIATVFQRLTSLKILLVFRFLDSEFPVSGFTRLPEFQVELTTKLRLKTFAIVPISDLD